ncbi:hypothetical protein [Cellulosimicrobium marinum]|uniref:hypothetical protein n=1 Tax=Cellulosimicrobium marinum TaxID=1638992 RepID=UPI001E28277B|nr:hypothetical protein [Cellulosimicrobium marinum]MCB7135109.1 hypothetical protein [Cellulosimicrobium marinum]
MAFVAGVATVLVGVATTLAIPLVLSSARYDYAVLGTIQTVNGVLSALLGLVAVVTGAVVLVRRAGGTALAAAGVALGASAILGLVVSFAQGALYRVM